MTSVGGDAAALLGLSDLRAAAAQVKRVLSEDETQKRTRVEAGLENATLFSTAKMMEKYVRIYRELAASREPA